MQTQYTRHTLNSVSPWEIPRQTRRCIPFTHKLETQNKAAGGTWKDFDPTAYSPSRALKKLSLSTVFLGQWTCYMLSSALQISESGKRKRKKNNNQRSYYTSAPSSCCLPCVLSQLLSRFPRRERKRHQLHVYQPMNSEFLVCVPRLLWRD